MIEPVLLLAKVAGSDAQLPRRSKMVGLRTNAYVDKQVSQLDACTKQAPQHEDAIAASKPPKHGYVVSDLVFPFNYAHSDKRGIRLGGDAVGRHAQRSVQPAALYRTHNKLGWRALRWNWFLADRTKASDRVKRNNEAWRARWVAGRRSRQATELSAVVLVTRAARTIVSRSMFTALR